MKPFYSTACLLRISVWVSHAHHCIRSAIAARNSGNTANKEWWLERAKLHGVLINQYTARYFEIR